MAKIAMYFNSRASGFSKNEWEQSFSKHLFRHELTFFSPNSLQELKYNLRKSKSDGTEIIFLVGGDGTVNSVLSELIDAEFKIVIIPAGTANDLARELGLTQDISKTIKAFQYKTIRDVDVISVNDSYFLTVGGFGIANDVVSEINTIRSRSPKFKKFMSFFGSHTYAMFLAKELILKKLESYKLRVDLEEDGKRFEVDASMFYVSNQSTIGGNFKVAPEAINNDGKFNVSIFTHNNKLDLVKAILTAKQGKSLASDTNVIEFVTNRMRVSHYGKEELSFFGDGESLGSSNYFDISIHKNKMKFYCMDEYFSYENSHSLNTIERV